MDIAVVTMACHFPEADTPERFWANVRDGRVSIRFFGREETLATGIPASIVDDPGYVPARGYLDGGDLFDASYFGYSPRDAAMIDPQQRLLLECAHDALEQGGWLRSRARVGVFVGTGVSQYLLAMIAHPGLRDRLVPLEIIGGERDVVATRLAYKLDLTGPAYTVQTACSTSLAAVHLAVAALRSGECDAAIAGGASLSVPALRGYRYEEGGPHSPDGVGRTFDVNAAGTVPGNGAGVVLLRRLADAVADGDPIQAVIKGSAAANDGANKVAFVAPSVTGQAQTIAAAYANAGVDPGTVGYVEAHGTGTRLGDPVEVAALTEVFTAGGPLLREGCVLGSVKPNIGHLDTAAGIAGLIKAVQALRHRTLPGTPHFTAPNPLLHLERGPFHVLSQARPWPAQDEPRRAAVSSLGVGGTNVHVVLEEAFSGQDRVVREIIDDAERPVIVVATGRSAAACRGAATHLGEWVAAEPDGLGAADVGAATTIGRRHGDFRAFTVVSGVSELAAPLASAEPVRAAQPAPRIALVFPGAGVQYVGMAGGLRRNEPVFRAAVAQCREALLSQGGPDIEPLLDPPAGGPMPGSGIEDPALALPVLFSVQYGLSKLLGHWGVSPEAMLGHSMGEYVAATVAGVFGFEQAITLLHRRGELATRTSGAMLLVRMPEEQIAPLLNERISLAAANAPDSFVLSGDHDALEDLARRLRANEVGSRFIPVGASGHSPLLDPVLGEFRDYLAAVALAEPKVPFVSNLTGTWIEPAQATDPEYWVRHFRHTVRFADGVRVLAEHPTVAIVAGPGRSIVGWAARLLPRSDGHSVVSCLPAAEEAHQDERELLNALGRAWSAGVSVDWTTVFAARKARRLATPGIGMHRRRHWVPGVTGAWLGGDAPAGNQALEFDQPSDADDREEGATAYAPPATPMQEALTEIWSRLLGMGRVGIHDDFFELGGDSLLAVRIAAQARQRLRIGVQPALIVAARTIARVAATLSEGGQAAVAAVDLPAAVDAAVAKLGSLHIGRPTPDAAPAILVTGVSGNLGPYLLRELLERHEHPVIAVVRAKDPDHAAARIKAALTERSLWEPEFAGRIRALPGDLARPHLNLDDSQWRELRGRAVEIYHAGAEVNFVRPFDLLVASNVEGTAQLVTLATESGAHLHYLSTLGVLDREDSRGERVMTEDPLGGDPGRLYTGYTQSKWVAEKVVQAAVERGLRATTYRIGMVVGDSATGRCNAGDLFWRFISTCARIGKAPHRPGGVAALPVDRVAAILVTLAAQRPQGVLHLSPEPVPWSRIWTWIDGVEVHSYGDWLHAVTSAADTGARIPLAPVMGALADLLPEQGMPLFDAQRARRLLAGAQRGLDSLTQQEFQRSLHYLRNVGDAPTDRSLT